MGLAFNGVLQNLGQVAEDFNEFCKNMMTKLKNKVYSIHFFFFMYQSVLPGKNDYSEYVFIQNVGLKLI